jgi:uncharacterized membrane protein YkvA (DUF1232 family)
MRKLFLLRHLMKFRHDLVRLWRAFFDARTPLYLKAAMIGAVAYLVSPFDLVPEFLLGFGLVDDLVLVPLVLSWIANRLPPGVGETEKDVKTMQGTVRRR